MRWLFCLYCTLWPLIGCIQTEIAYREYQNAIREGTWPEYHNSGCIKLCNGGVIGCNEMCGE